MFHVGFSELVLLSLVGLLVLDSKRWLTLTGELTDWARAARRTVIALRRQLERETGFKAEIVERPRPKLRVVPRDSSKSAANTRRSV
jgi:Sec-independent protein translocase protein TatA